MNIRLNPAKSAYFTSETILSDIDKKDHYRYLAILIDKNEDVPTHLKELRPIVMGKSVKIRRSSNNKLRTSFILYQITVSSIIKYCLEAVKVSKNNLKYVKEIHEINDMCF